MKRLRRCGPAAPLALLLALACGVSGCALPSTPGKAATPTSRAGASSPLTAATGKWVYKDQSTVETLRLRQGKRGNVTGDGDSAKNIGKHQIAHSSIDVNAGHLSKGKLTLTLYITPLDWGNGTILVEYLTCNATTRVLHCRMDAPMYAVRGVKQDFARRA